MSEIVQANLPDILSSYRQGDSVSAIMRRYKVGQRSVNKALKAHGIERFDILVTTKRSVQNTTPQTPFITT